MTMFSGSTQSRTSLGVVSRVLMIWLSVLTVAFSTISISALAQGEPDPGGGGGSWPSAPSSALVEWEKRQNADQRLTAFGDDLMGDGIDPHTGSISFQHTDVFYPRQFRFERGFI